MSDKTGAVRKTRRLGRLLIWGGVAVWIPYFALKVTGNQPELMLFLPFHLMGVIPGAILARWDQLKRLVRRS